MTQDFRSQVVYPPHDVDCPRGHALVGEVCPPHGVACPERREASKTRAVAAGRERDWARHMKRYDDQQAAYWLSLGSTA